MALPSQWRGATGTFVRLDELSQLARNATAWSQATPPYIFDTKFGLRCAEGSAKRQCLDEWATLVPMIAPFTAGRYYGRKFSFDMLQFGLGGPLTGAPFHYHKPAFNALMWGRKRWAVLPPQESVVSATPAARLFSRTLAQMPSMFNVTPWQCVQEPGDVFVLPGGWAHATLNLDTISIALAGEWRLVPTRGEAA